MYFLTLPQEIQGHEGLGLVTKVGSIVNANIGIKEGDMVVFGQYAGSNTVKIDGDELVVLNEQDILGVLDK